MRRCALALLLLCVGCGYDADAWQHGYRTGKAHGYQLGIMECDSSYQALIEGAR